MTAEHSPLSLSTVLVTGGSGGLASKILELFSQRGCKRLHSIDIRQPSHLLHGVTYHLGDLTDVDAMRQIFHEVKPDVVIHTASPRFDTPNHIMYKVNVEGTKNLVQIAQESGAHSFVYTSSASVISDGKTDLENADESYPVILGDQQPEYYTHTKALAETYVLLQNHRSRHLTPVPDLRNPAIGYLWCWRPGFAPRYAGCVFQRADQGADWQQQKLIRLH